VRKHEKPAKKEDRGRQPRDAAAKKLARTPGAPPEMKDKTPEEIVYELRMHQIELEMKNKDLRRAQLALEESLRYAESIVETVREPLLILDEDLKIISANRNFYITFKVNPGETLGRFIYDLGDKQWDIPKLRTLLENIIPEDTEFNDYEIEHEFLNIGHKIMLLNARRIYRKNMDAHMILIAIEDITERKKIENRLEINHKELEMYRDHLETLVAERTRQLNERVKGLQCLYAISSLVVVMHKSIDEMLKAALYIIPPGWLYPEITCVRIVFEGREFATANFRDTAWKQSADIVISKETVGTVEVCYLEEKPTLDEGPFLKEERDQVIDIARRLGVIIGCKRVEEKLVRLNQQHKLILCSVAEGILGLDLQGNHIFVNPAAARMLGYEAEELLGRPSHSTWHHTKPDGSPCLEEECAIHTSYREGAAYSVTTDVFWRKDGTSFPVEYAIKPIYEKDRLVGTVLTFADITERRQAEKQIHRQSKLLAAINSVFFETLTSDSEETVAKTCLKVAQEITDSKFGIIGEITPEGLFTATYLSDPGWEACRIPETQAIVLLKDMVIRGIWGQVILKEQSLIVNDPVSYPDRVGIPEGHPPLTSFLGVPLRDQGEVIGMIALANNASGYKAEHQQDMEALCVAFVEAIRRKQAENDLSKTLKNLKESQDMLIRSEKLSAIGQLSAGVAHEILNPVNIMGMKLQMLEMTEALSEKTKEAIRTCENQIKRITKITRDLQQFARVSEKQITPSNINELIEQVFSLMGPRIKIEDVKVDARYQADLPLVPLDRDRMGQIVLNLINNALDAMKGRPERVLRVTTELTDKNVVRLSFSDTGTGIPPEILSKIFDPFFTTKEEGKGTGLGLSISYGIIQDHGGTILAENNAEGGASFFIDLPVEGTDGGK
jgi:PAS domain S-box-containing protein